MTDLTPEAATTAGSSRRTAVMLAAWLAAAAVAGLPDGADRTANAKPRAGRVATVNTGPACFAGHAVPPAASKSGR
jgi:hypothetical protein